MNLNQLNGFDAEYVSCLKESDFARGNISYSLLGLPESSQEEQNRELSYKFSNMNEKCCLHKHQQKQFKNAIKTLEKDHVFSELNILGELPNKVRNSEEYEKCYDVFSSLCLEDKATLLTVLGCVVEAPRKGLVLISKPENYVRMATLPLLIQAISDILTENNGVAFIITGSPVVLQNIPSKCVYKLRKPGDNLVVEHPVIETFGAAITTIADEVLWFNVRNTRFYQAINAVAEKSNDYQEAVNLLGRELGNEASIILRSLIACK